METGTLRLRPSASTARQPPSTPLISTCGAQPHPAPTACAALSVPQSTTPPHPCALPHSLRRRVAALALRLGRLSEARFAAEQGLRVNARHPLLLELLLEVSLALGDPSTAKAAADALLRCEEGHPRATAVRRGRLRAASAPARALPLHARRARPALLLHSPTRRLLLQPLPCLLTPPPRVCAASPGQSWPAAQPPRSRP